MAGKFKWTLVCVASLAAVIVWLLTRHDVTSTSPIRWVISLLLPVGISAYGMRRKSLDYSGGMTAVLVGTVLTAASANFCAALLTFFVTSSRLTKWRAQDKKKIEEDHRDGGQRNWIQVICNGGVATLASVLYIQAVGMGEKPILLSARQLQSDDVIDQQLFQATVYSLACVSALACSCGDTWASEVGSVLGGTPRLVTTWRRVPRGTNGGITLIGTLCSVAGGVAVGIGYLISAAIFVDFSDYGDLWLSQVLIVALGGVAGLLGSLVDSLLGATVQYSGYSNKLRKVVNAPGHHGNQVQHISGVDILGNHAVNFVSSLVTALVVPCAYLYLWT